MIVITFEILLRLGFPYSASLANPSPQRALIIHTARQFHDKTGKVTRDDSGYFVMNLDRNSPMSLMEWVPEYYTMKQLTQQQCQKYLHCGMPVYYPATTMLK